MFRPMGSNSKQSRVHYHHDNARHNSRGSRNNGHVPMEESLALFREMKDRESRNFLHPSKDHGFEASELAEANYEDQFRIASSSSSSSVLMASTTSSCSLKLGSDLLTLDSEKNDYDWLLTPPTTPLFPSLDEDGEDAPAIANLSQRRILTRSSSSVSKAHTQLSYAGPEAAGTKRPAQCANKNASPGRSRRSVSMNTSPVSSSGGGKGRMLTMVSNNASTTSAWATSPGPAGRSSSRPSTPILYRTNGSPSPGRRRRGPTAGAKSRGAGSLSPELRPPPPPPPPVLAAFPTDLPPPPNLRTSRPTAKPLRAHGRARTRSLSGEAADLLSCRTPARGHPDLDAGWAASNASVASPLCLEEEAGSRAGSDNGSTKNNDPCVTVVPRKCAVPATKRHQLRAAASEIMPYPSFPYRRSNESQAGTQRRNNSQQSMFRPLLSNVPASSLYTTRAAGYTQHQAMSESSVAHPPCVDNVQHSDEDGNDDAAVGEETVSESLAMNMDLQLETMHHEAEASLASDLEEGTGNSYGNVGCLDSLVGSENLDSRNDEDDAGTLVPSLDAQPREMMQEGCTNLTQMQEGCTNLTQTRKQNKFSASQYNNRKMLDRCDGTYRSEWGSKSNDSEHGAHDYDTVARTHSYSPVLLGYSSQKNSIDVGSFQKPQSSMSRSMTLSMRSQDSISYTERTVSCDLSRSGSHRFSWGSPSNTVGDARSFAVRSDNVMEIAPESTVAQSETTCPSSDGGHLDDMKDYALSETGYPAEVNALTNKDSNAVAAREVSMDEIVQQDDMLEALQHNAVRSHSSDGLDTLADVLSTSEASNDQDRSTFRAALICDDGLPKAQDQPPALKRNVTTLEEATNTILFCSSIIHELIYKAASLAMQREEDRRTANVNSNREVYGGPISAFGQKMGELGLSRNNANTRRSVSRETSSLVQKQWMVHRHTPAVTMRHTAMEDVHNAILGNHEQQQLDPTAMLEMGEDVQSKRVECKCNCSVM